MVKMKKKSVLTMASSLMSSATMSSVSPVQSSMVAPFTGLKSMLSFPVTKKANDGFSKLPSNNGRVQCMKEMTSALHPSIPSSSPLLRFTLLQHWECRIISNKKGTAMATKENEEKAEKYMNMSGMSLNNLSHLFLNLATIAKLDLSNNNLQSIPESVTARLANMVTLDVQSNQLKDQPL